MYQNKNGGTGRHILKGYIRPFTKNGFLPFILSFVLTLIPFVQILVPALTYSDAPSFRNGGVGRLGRLSLKILAATLLLFAPSLALYLLNHLLGSILRVGPAWLLYILLGLMLFFAISALIRLPMAFAALARGSSVREAVDGRFVKLLISAGFGSYIACLVCLFPFAILAFFIDLLPLWPAYIYSAFLTAWILSYLGYVINRCYDKAAPALGLPAGPPAPAGSGSRYARTAVSLLLVLAMLGQFGSALAFNEDEEMASGNYPKYQYTESEYRAAVEKFTRSGQLNQHTQLKYNSDTGDFYCTMDPTTPHPQRDLAIAVADLTADCLPVIGTAKNMVEVVYYKRIADDPTKSAAERKEARDMQYFKFFCAAVSLAGPLGKATSMATGKGVVSFMMYKYSTSVKGIENLIKGTDFVLKGWEFVINVKNVVNAAKANLATGEPLTPSPSEGVDEQPGNEQQQGTEQQPDGPVSLNGDYSPFWGTYKGTLVCSTNTAEVDGAVITFDNPEVTITLQEDGFTTLSYTYNADFSYQTPGASMNASLTLPVSIDILTVDMIRTLSGYMGSASSSGYQSTMITKYAGEGYKDGGGEITTSQSYTVDCWVTFELRRVNGQIVAIADGYGLQRPSGTEESLYMSFRITKAG